MKQASCTFLFLLFVTLLTCGRSFPSGISVVNQTDVEDTVDNRTEIVDALQPKTTAVANERVTTTKPGSCPQLWEECKTEDKPCGNRSCGLICKNMMNIFFVCKPEIADSSFGKH